MKKSIAVLVAAMALIALPASDLSAQVALGPQFVLVDVEEPAIGVRVDFGLGEAFGIQDGFFEGLFGTVNGNYVFVDGPGTNLVFNANLAVPITTAAAVSPYVGAGFNINRYSVDVAGVNVSNNNTGLNLLGGLFFNIGALPAAVEAQYSTTGSGYLSLGAALLFGL